MFHELLNVVMVAPSGPLQRPVRCYVAMMAAARMRCTYLVDEQEKEFLRYKGDPVWLGGIHLAPKKLQNLQQLNAVMGAMPWMVGKEHIEALTRGEDAWSVAELVHALVILSTFHSLAGFVWAMGVAPEVDSASYTEEMRRDSASSSPQSFTPDPSNDMTLDIINKMKNRLSAPLSLLSLSLFSPFLFSFSSSLKTPRRQRCR